jgi:addiction module HigA family antidote
MPETLSNVHPGEVLLEKFLKPLGLSQNKLAREIKAPPRRVNEIVFGKRSLISDTALRLARYFGTSEEFWLGLQLDFDLEEARRLLSAVIDRAVLPIALHRPRPLPSTLPGGVASRGRRRFVGPV